MHNTLRTAAIVTLFFGVSARSASANSETPQEALWRDQWVFLGDEGEVVALVLQRRNTGLAEVKSWVGFDDKWRSHSYDMFEIAQEELADVADSLTAWIRHSRRVRAVLDRTGGGLSLSVRAPSFSIRLTAERLVALGETKDPEGVSSFEAGQARFTLGRRERQGIVVVEHTPPEHPHRAHVEYGNFTFVVARVGARLVVAKHSDLHHKFNQSLVVNTTTWARQPSIRVSTSDNDLRVIDPDEKSATLHRLDKSASAGVALNGSRRRHDVWLLGGDGTGVAFRIIPEAAR